VRKRDAGVRQLQLRRVGRCQRRAAVTALQLRIGNQLRGAARAMELSQAARVRRLGRQRFREGRTHARKQKKQQ